MAIGLRALGVLFIPATLLPLLVAAVDPGLGRLASMPPSTRLELAARLDRFDRLPAGEQRAIRELDAALERLDPEEKRRYLDLLHRYGSWLRGLDDEDRRAIEEAPADRRLGLIRRRLGPAGTPESPGIDPALWARADAFNPVPLYDAAALLRVWAALDDRGRRRVESARAFDEKLATLRRLGRERGIEPSPGVVEAFRAIVEEQIRRAGPGQRSPRLVPEAGVDPISWLLDPLQGPEGRPGSGPGAGNPGRRPPGPVAPPAPLRGAAASRLAEARLALLRSAELEFLRAVRALREAPPPGVLLAFEARLPDWYRGTLDPLPPEMARLRLLGLRRLLLEDPDVRAWLSGAAPPDAPSPAEAPPPPEPPGGRRAVP